MTGGLGELDVALGFEGGQPLLYRRDCLHSSQGHRRDDAGYDDGDGDEHRQQDHAAALPGRVGPADSRGASFSTDPHVHLIGRRKR